VKIFLLVNGSFLNIYILQGSADTYLRRVGIFTYTFCCKFTTESASGKKFENRLTFGDFMGKSLVSCFFGLTVYIKIMPAVSQKQTNHSTLPRG